MPLKTNPKILQGSFFLTILPIWPSLSTAVCLLAWTWFVLYSYLLFASGFLRFSFEVFFGVPWCASLLRDRHVCLVGCLDCLLFT